MKKTARLVVPKGPQAELVMVVGKRGKGKTNWVCNEVKQFRRVLIYDTVYEPAYRKFRTETDFVDLAKFLMNNPSYFQIAYRSQDDVEMSEDFDRFIRLAFEVPNSTVVVEEVDLFASSHKISPPFQRFIAIGRHRGLSCYCVSRRAHNINPLIRSQANRVISFRQTEPHDIEALREVIGNKADEVRRLQVGEYVEWDEKDSD